tara:strand:+ start:149 stop:352 length:204 start_codon:yes stop_codon:yes gene_type:complete
MTIFVNIDTLINGTIYDKLKKKYNPNNIVNERDDQSTSSTSSEETKTKEANSVADVRRIKVQKVSVI